MGENCYQLHIDDISAGPDLNVCTYCQPPAFICSQALLFFVQIFSRKKDENILNNGRLQLSWNSVITQINLKISAQVWQSFSCQLYCIQPSFIRRSLGYDKLNCLCVVVTWLWLLIRLILSPLLNIFSGGSCWFLTTDK